ncbi:DUF6177 family protein [Streptomyces longisporoflavus]|uniref:DUF6177 family protein n=1 Tax=Streptomyces longisporoflavus TaxID=28044 RepID=A0ABW7QEX9_9ACTN
MEFSAGALLTVPPRLEALPIPLSFTLGANAVNEIGRSHAPQAGARAAQLSPAAYPALHYTLGDGTDPKFLDHAPAAHPPPEAATGTSMTDTAGMAAPAQRLLPLLLHHVETSFKGSYAAGKRSARTPPAAQTASRDPGMRG